MTDCVFTYQKKLRLKSHIKRGSPYKNDIKHYPDPYFSIQNKTISKSKDTT